MRSFLYRLLFEETAKETPSVIITKAPCRLLIKEQWPIYQVDAEKCIDCGACLTLGCPPIQKSEYKVTINEALCSGCGVCATICPKMAIYKEGEIG